jgi:hypothetical protein
MSRRVQCHVLRSDLRTTRINIAVGRITGRVLVAAPGRYKRRRPASRERTATVRGRTVLCFAMADVVVSFTFL